MKNFMISKMHERLREIRKNAGFESATQAADFHRWTVPTYSAHENGSRGMRVDSALKYAQAFRADPCYLAFGTRPNEGKIADIPTSTLRDVLDLVLNHTLTRDLPPAVVSDLIVEVCKYVHQSGTAGLGNVIDFQVRRLQSAR